MRRRIFPAVVPGVVLATVLATVLAIVAAFAALGGALLAQEKLTAEELSRRVEWVRTLAPEQKAKLKAALERFHGMSPAERDALRRKAAKVGPERLDGLAGRDLDALRHSKSALDGDADRVMAALGPDRLAPLSDDERTWLRAEAMRGFQRHMQRRLLGNTSYEDLQKLSPDERRKLMADARRRMLQARFDSLPDEERARIQALSQAERKAELAKLVDDQRADEAREFAKVFDRYRLQKHLLLTPAERTQVVARWRVASQWHEVVRLLKTEIGISDEARGDLAVLGPQDLARLRFQFEQSADRPFAERRAQLEQLIHEIAGERSIAPARRAQTVPPYVRALRERRMHWAAGSDGPEPPRTGTISPR